MKTQKCIELLYCYLDLDPADAEEDMKNGILTANEGRDGNLYFWYLDADGREAAMDLQNGKFLTEAEIDQILV